MNEETPNRAKRDDDRKRAHHHQTDEKHSDGDNERQRDPQDEHTDEHEPIRQQNRYDPGHRRPQ